MGISSNPVVSNHRLSILLLSLGIVGWSLPAQASPQLLYEFIEMNGNLSTCLKRAETAMRRSGFVRQNVRQNSINAQTGQMSATVHCRSINRNLSEAVLMVAGTRVMSAPNIQSVFNSIAQDIGDSPVSTPSQSSSEAMSDGDFGQLMNALRRNWSKPIEFLTRAVRHNYFTTSQAIQIIKEMKFGSRQVEAAVLLYPQIVDRGNWFMLEQALTFESDRRELRRQIANLSEQ